MSLNLDQAAGCADWLAWAGLDTLDDFHAFLQSGPIARLPVRDTTRRVAIVGAGAAGLVAAYELLRIGAEPVIFEATARIGGRAYSRTTGRHRPPPSLNWVSSASRSRSPFATCT